MKSEIVDQAGDRSELRFKKSSKEEVRKSTSYKVAKLAQAQPNARVRESGGSDRLAIG